MAATADWIEARVEVPRKTWTRDEVHALVEAGIVNAEKWELIDGELIDWMSKKHPHIFWQHLALIWLHRVFGGEYVRVESPTDVLAEDNFRNEPEPDLAVTVRSIREYTENPPPNEIRLAIEVSDSSLDFDLTVKMRLYARAEIVEYWVLNVRDKQVVVHREPKGGVYTNLVIYNADEEFSPLAATGAMFCLNRL